MYRVIWLEEGRSLETFKGKIIEVLHKQHYVDKYENTWSFQCLVEVEENEDEQRRN